MRYLRFLPLSIFPLLLVLSSLLPLESASAQTVTILYRFSGGTDGGFPYAGLVVDSHGNLFGTTVRGGAFDRGTVFQITPGGTETVLHSFEGGTDGELPYSGLVFDAQGNLYGTTSAAGLYGFGTIFKLTPTGTETVLHHFHPIVISTGRSRPTDGDLSQADLTFDSQGNLYGTTYYGGIYGGSSACKHGCGAVFKLVPDGTETTLHGFAKRPDGNFPERGVAFDAQGNLYGTTTLGGANDCYQNWGCGIVFKLAPDGTETVLHSFAGGTDGEMPYSSLILDTKGNLYGTTVYGGVGCDSGYGGCGTVFKISPGGTETVLYRFTGGADGISPSSGLVMDAQGNLYGTTLYGGAACAGSCGTVFKLSPNGRETILYNFTGGTDGANPDAGLVMDAQGNFYGTTTSGGFPGCFTCGTVFKLTP